MSYSRHYGTASRRRSSSGGSGCAAIVLFMIFVAGYAIFQKSVGVGGWGPENRVQGATVTRTYVDFSGTGENRESHYMVATDKGVFEVNNGWMLGVWNADEIYGRLKPGEKYDFTTKGNRVVNWYAQEYPYITSATLSSSPVESR
jgi:hypothetical protein